MYRGEEDYTLEKSADGTPPLVAAPRHLRRRRLHEEIPDTLLVPGVEPAVAAPPGAGLQAPGQSVKPRSPEAAKSHRRKRLVALILTILVAVSLACLVLVLLLNY